MKRPVLAATAPLALAFALAACGSVTGIDDLFQDSSGSGGAVAATTGQGGAPGVTAVTVGVGGSNAVTAVSASSGPSTTSGGSTTAASGSTTASGSTATSGPTTSVGPGSTGPGGPGATGPGSTGPGGPGGPGASSSSGGPGNTVYCNNAPCAAGQICCFSPTDQSDHCGPPGSCGDGYIDLECNGPEDCPGGVCCADVNYQKNPPYQGISCKQSCNNPSKNLIVCADDQDCGPGKHCAQSQTLGTGYKICKQ